MEDLHSLECVVCSRLAQYAVLTSCCSALACWVCAISNITQGKCGTCNSHPVLSSLVPHHHVRRKVEEIEMRKQVTEMEAVGKNNFHSCTSNKRPLDNTNDTNKVEFKRVKSNLSELKPTEINNNDFSQELLESEVVEEIQTVETELESVNNEVSEITKYGITESIASDVNKNTIWKMTQVIDIVKESSEANSSLEASSAKHNQAKGASVIKQELTDVKKILTIREQEMEQLKKNIQDKKIKLTLAEEENKQIVEEKAVLLEALKSEQEKASKIKEELTNKEINQRVVQIENMTVEMKEMRAENEAIKKKMDEREERYNKVIANAKSKIKKMELENRELQKKLIHGQADTAVNALKTAGSQNMTLETDQIREENEAMAVKGIKNEVENPYYIEEVEIVEPISITNTLPSKWRIIFMDCEKLSDGDHTQFTQIGCYVYRVSSRKTSSFFMPMYPSKIEEYLQMKQKSDLLKALHLAWEKEIGFQFLEPDGEKIKAVSESEGFEDFLIFLGVTSEGESNVLFLNSANCILPLLFNKINLNLLQKYVAGICELDTFLSKSPGDNDLTNLSHTDDIYRKVMGKSFEEITPTCAQTAKYMFIIVEKISADQGNRNLDFESFISKYFKPTSHFVEKFTNVGSSGNEKASGDTVSLEIETSFRPGFPATLEMCRVDVLDLAGLSDEARVDLTGLKDEAPQYLYTSKNKVRKIGEYLYTPNNKIRKNNSHFRIPSSVTVHESVRKFSSNEPLPMPVPGRKTIVHKIAETPLPAAIENSARLFDSRLMNKEVFQNMVQKKHVKGMTGGEQKHKKEFIERKIEDNIKIEVFQEEGEEEDEEDEEDWVEEEEENPIDWRGEDLGLSVKKCGSRLAGRLGDGSKIEYEDREVKVLEEREGRASRRQYSRYVESDGGDSLENDNGEDLKSEFGNAANMLIQVTQKDEIIDVDYKNTSQGSYWEKKSRRSDAERERRDRDRRRENEYRERRRESECKRKREAKEMERGKRKDLERERVLQRICQERELNRLKEKENEKRLNLIKEQSKETSKPISKRKNEESEEECGEASSDESSTDPESESDSSSNSETSSDSSSDSSGNKEVSQNSCRNEIIKKAEEISETSMKKMEETQTPSIQNIKEDYSENPAELTKDSSNPDVSRDSQEQDK